MVFAVFASAEAAAAGRRAEPEAADGEDGACFGRFELTLAGNSDRAERLVAGIVMVVRRHER